MFIRKWDADAVSNEILGRASYHRLVASLREREGEKERVREREGEGGSKREGEGGSKRE